MTEKITNDMNVLMDMVKRWNTEKNFRTIEQLFCIVKYAEGCNVKLDIKIGFE